MKLKPEFSDCRVCGYCGAPAARLGREWTRDGIEDWWDQPIEIRCAPGTPGAEARHIERETGGRSKTDTHYVRVFTHECIRRGCDAPDGTTSMASEHLYECGVLMLPATRRVSVDEMDPRCFEDDGRMGRHER